MYQELFKDFALTEGEEKLLQHAETPQTAQISHAKVLSDLYTIKKSEKFIKELIISNEKLSVSNGKYALSLNMLTGALVIVGVLQIIVTYLSVK